MKRILTETYTRNWTGLDKLRARNRSGKQNLWDAPSFSGSQILPLKENVIRFKNLQSNKYSEFQILSWALALL